LRLRFASPRGRMDRALLLVEGKLVEGLRAPHSQN
jgi:hypothetical protein